MCDNPIDHLSVQGADRTNVDDVDRIYQICKYYVEEERSRGGIHLKALIRAANFFNFSGEQSFCAEIIGVANMIVTIDELISKEQPKIAVFEEIGSHFGHYHHDNHDVHVIIDATDPEHKEADVETLLNVAAFLLRIRSAFDWSSFHNPE